MDAIRLLGRAARDLYPPPDHPASVRGDLWVEEPLAAGDGRRFRRVEPLVRERVLSVGRLHDVD